MPKLTPPQPNSSPVLTCTTTAAPAQQGMKSVDLSISCGSMTFSSVWYILCGCSLTALPSCSLSDPSPPVSLWISDPNHSAAPQLSMNPLAWNPAWGTSFLTHDDLSIWGEVIHLACACRLDYCAFIMRPHPTPSLLHALIAGSWIWSHGFKRRQGWTDQHMAGLVFSFNNMNKPGQFLF